MLKYNYQHFIICLYFLCDLYGLIKYYHYETKINIARNIVVHPVFVAFQSAKQQTGDFTYMIHTVNLNRLHLMRFVIRIWVGMPVVWV